VPGWTSLIPAPPTVAGCAGTLPGGQALTGMAVGVDPAGRLELRTSGGLVRVSAGDVVHLRAAGAPAAQ
jgi:hypothetical protein